eukprot:sb/3476618/
MLTISITCRAVLSNKVNVVVSGTVSKLRRRAPIDVPFHSYKLTDSVQAVKRAWGRGVEQGNIIPCWRKKNLSPHYSNQEPTDTSKQPIITRYLGHDSRDWLSANQGPVLPDSVGC